MRRKNLDHQWSILSWPWLRHRNESDGFISSKKIASHFEALDPAILHIKQIGGPDISPEDFLQKKDNWCILFAQ